MAARAASAGIISAPRRQASFVIAMIIPASVTSTIAICVQIQLEGTAPHYRGTRERLRGRRG